MERLGKYHLRKVLGKGASGTVYLALDTFSGEHVALKVLDHEVVSSPDFERTIAAQFLNEASLAGKLAHPHIAAILEASISREFGYIAIEYVPGGDLSRYIASGKLLSRADVIQLAFKCCGALDYAYRQGIVHRDLKPANIMVVSGTDIKIADFGAAYLKTSGTPAADIGSPYYMSPEQIRRKDLDHHSDMYSLGVVLYELFTGHRPFQGQTLEELFARVLNEAPLKPSALCAELPPQIDEIVLRMLAKEPAARYATWADLALEIAKIGRLSVYEQEVPDSEKFALLKSVPMLKQLREPELWELAQAADWKRVPARTRIVVEGDKGQSLSLLASGEAKVTRRGRLLSVLRPGECFGEMAYIKKGKLDRQATIDAITDAVVAEFDTERLEDTTLNCRLQLTYALLNSLTDRLALANERLTRI